MKTIHILVLLPSLCHGLSVALYLPAGDRSEQREVGWISHSPACRCPRWSSSVKQFSGPQSAFCRGRSSGLHCDDIGPHQRPDSRSSALLATSLPLGMDIIISGRCYGVKSVTCKPVCVLRVDSQKAQISASPTLVPAWKWLCSEWALRGVRGRGGPSSQATEGRTSQRRLIRFLCSVAGRNGRLGR